MRHRSHSTAIRQEPAPDLASTVEGARAGDHQLNAYTGAQHVLHASSLTIRPRLEAGNGSNRG